MDLSFSLFFLSSASFPSCSQSFGFPRYFSVPQISLFVKCGSVRLGREMVLKAEQTPATLTSLITLRTWNLEGLFCICVCECVCVLLFGVWTYVSMSTSVTWALLKVYLHQGVKDRTGSKIQMKSLVYLIFLASPSTFSWLNPDP